MLEQPIVDGPSESFDPPDATEVAWFALLGLFSFVNNVGFIEGCVYYCEQFYRYRMQSAREAPLEEPDVSAPDHSTSPDCRAALDMAHFINII